MAQYKEVFENKGQTFLIRNATGEDAAEIIRYMEIVDRETTFLSREPGEAQREYPLEKEKTFLQTTADRESNLFLVVRSPQGEVVATCNCQYNPNRFRLRHVASLGISVRQDFWKMGLARKMMQIQEDWCRTQGIEKLTLEVDTTNLRAIGLYLSRGFVVEGTLRRAAKMADGSWRDRYAMAKFLD